MALLRKQPNAGGALSPERAALALAVAAHAEAEAQCAATAAASGPASEAVWAAQRAVQDATAALEQAKADAARHLRDVAMGAAGEPPRSIREAREALLDAETVLQAARDARDGLKVLLPDQEARRELSKIQLRNAALDVLKSEAAPLVAELVEKLGQAQRAVADLGNVLEWMVHEKVIEIDPATDSPAKMARSRLGTPPCMWRALTAEDATPGAAPWRAAFDALQRDANAPLPT